MGGLMAIMGVGGLGMSLFGGYSADKAQRKAADYNAKILEQKAIATEQAMEQETKRAHDQARQLKGSQKAIASKMGAMISEGTPLTVLAEQAGAMEKDIIEHRRTRGIEAESYRQEAAMAKYSSKMQHRAANIGAAGSLLGGAAMLGQSFMGGVSTGGGGSGISGADSFEMLSHIRSMR